MAASTAGMYDLERMQHPGHEGDALMVQVFELRLPRKEVLENWFFR